MPTLPQRSFSVFCLLLAALFAAPLAAQPPAADKPAAKAEAPPKSPPEEKSAVTHHTVTLDGKPIAYTATAGTLQIKDDDGTVKALVFYVAYMRDGVKDPGTRPVTFSFNGGPGSAGEVPAVSPASRQTTSSKATVDTVRPRAIASYLARHRHRWRRRPSRRRRGRDGRSV